MEKQRVFCEGGTEFVSIIWIICIKTLINICETFWWKNLKLHLTAVK